MVRLLKKKVIVLHFLTNNAGMKLHITINFIFYRVHVFEYNSFSCFLLFVCFLNSEMYMLRDRIIEILIKENVFLG